MLAAYHTAITRRALESHFGRAALTNIIKANLRQDSLAGLIGHPEYHFDDNSFEASRAYMEEQRGMIPASLLRGEAGAAHAAFGRLLHTAQDFYAHTDYVARWLARFDAAAPPPPSEIDAVDPGLFSSPHLRSGRVNYVLEVLVLLPGLRGLILPHMAADSHARMNLDSPASSPLFEYAFEAAVKRTVYEFEQVKVQLADELLERFLHRTATSMPPADFAR